MSVLALINKPNSVVPVPTVPAQSPLPVQQIPKATAAKIEDSHGKLVAIGALIRYTNSQAYFVLQHLDNVLGKKAITVFTPDEAQPFSLRVKNIFDQPPDRTFLPMYIRVHFNPEERLPVEHLLDLLAHKTLGNFNLELRKNITIDMFDSEGDAFLRDKAGFIVSDRMRLEQATVDKKEFLSVLKPEKDVIVAEVTKKSEWDELLEYDATLSSHQRSEFLKFLFSKNKVFAARWTNDKLPEKKGGGEEAEGEAKKRIKIAGYMIVSQNIPSSADQQMFCLYASGKAIAEALVKAHLSQTKAKNLVFCTALSQWDKVRALKSFKRRPIYRRHTRTIPPNVKWEQIFALNIGMNLF